MLAVFMRFLTIIALAAMPFGMAAPASASPTHQMQMAPDAGHCDGQSQDDGRKAAIDCAMACSVMVEDQAQVQAVIGPPPMTTGRIPFRPMAGLHPEMEPPPPKRG